MKLPVIHGHAAASSLGTDGSRNRVYPADVRGRFIVARRITYALLIALWIALPWVRVGGHPAVFLDVETRQFYLFGASFNAQDTWLVFFLLTGMGFGLVYSTALLGRWWCGWACPQTVFLEFLFRPIERLVGGSREKRMRRDAGPWNLDRVWRWGVEHALYLVAALFVAHVFVSYFVSIPHLWSMMHTAPTAHPEAFAWMIALTGAFYFDFAWFREQVCVVVCPYGRLQSVLLDDDSLVVGYDERRGEPRGKVTNPEAGDCVDCGRCVAVCPTGIDIRNGLQIDCVACAQCIDACDEIMDKVHRPRGLIRYDSLHGLRGEPKKILRPRMYAYTVLLVAGAVAASIGFSKHTEFEANLLRLPGTPYTVENGVIRNAFEVHLVNKQSDRETYRIEPRSSPELHFIVPLPEVTLEPMGAQRVPIFVTMDTSAYTHDEAFRVVVTHEGGGKEAHEKELTATFLGAK